MILISLGKSLATEDYEYDIEDIKDAEDENSNDQDSDEESTKMLGNEYHPYIKSI